MLRKLFMVLLLIALPLVGGDAWGQGFGVFEHGTCAMGRAGTAVAKPCEDGSSLFFNPAGIAFLEGNRVSAGGTIINPRGGFTPTGGTKFDLATRYFPVPAVFVTGQMGRLTVGAGLFAPYGLETDWIGNNDNTTFAGRFLGYRTAVKGIYVQPTVAYKINDQLSVGGGLDITRASLELHQRVDLSVQRLSPTLTFGAIGVPAGTDFADVKLSGDAWSLGYNLGVQATVAPKVTIGARYLSRQNVTIDNGQFESRKIQTGLVTPIPLGPGIPAGTSLDAIVDPQFTGTGALANQSVALYNAASFTAGTTPSLTFPDQFEVGTAFPVAERTTAFLEYQFVHWTLFKQLVIVRANAASTPTILDENFKNTHGLRIGIEHMLNDALTIRGGFITHTAAAPDETVTPLLPEAPRREFTIGLGTRVSDTVHADFAYQYLMQSDREGRTGALPNNGIYDFMSHLFGATVTVRF